MTSLSAIIRSYQYIYNQTPASTHTRVPTTTPPLTPRAHANKHSNQINRLIILQLTGDYCAAKYRRLTHMLTEAKSTDVIYHMWAESNRCFYVGVA